MGTATVNDELAFDYVVVGGGLAGLVVATRLAEDPSVTVGVIEAGQDMSQDINIQTPALYSRGFRNPEVDWGFFTTPQDHVDGRKIYLPRGKGLGGSTLLNLMQLGRAHATEYDAFEALGNPGWNWPEFLKYFKKSETFSATDEDARPFDMTPVSEAHGTSGPLPSILPPYISDLHPFVLDAFKSLGVPLNPEPNNGDNTGVWTATTAIHPDSLTRGSSASAYYVPNKDKSNLRVITGAYATRVLFSDPSDAGVAAIGVEYLRNERAHMVAAKKEVILSTVAFKTPQLLELSGIGDRTILQSHDIPVVVELPGVGNNLQVHFTLRSTEISLTYLQDHFWCPFTCELDPGWESDDVLRDADRAAAEMHQYITTKKGMLTAAPMSAYAFLPVSTFSRDGKIEDGTKLQLDHVSTAFKGIHKTFDLQKEWLGNPNIPFLELASVSSYLPNTKVAPVEGKNYFSFLLGLLHPFSRGGVHINSANPTSSPNIDPRMLDNDVDLQILVSAIKYIRKVVTSPALKAALACEAAPGPEVQFDEELVRYIKANIQTIYHPVGTASKLPREDGGVVDGTLKVYGTKNLRIVDASIIPVQISAHIQHTVYAVAEKAADLIKSGLM
ncbi:hypothetical protein HGRIS_003157 [Hohenbuehelia grisea]|uniref:GMC oxidoreductase n=1 Tax=Hohenbuehelia grisea TaxID=104357 RepID=A0ABR3JMM9_9AGAR